MNNGIVHDSSNQRFQWRVDGRDCVLEYRLDGSTMTITHTGVPAELGGRGLASELTMAAFNEARSRGWRVVPACSYAAAWIRKHPEFSDLVD